MNGRVLAAFRRTPPEYLKMLLRTRSERCAEAAGSVYKLNPKRIEQRLLSLDWQECEFSEVQPPATGLTARWPGHFGLIDLTNGLVSDSTPIIFEDPKGTGMVSACIAVPLIRPRVLYSTLILGPNDDGREIIYTFHPGLPVRPSELPAGELLGRSMSVAEALLMGVRYAKVRA